MTLPALTDLQSIFGDIDVYLFDQLLKGRVQPGMKILDAGCGNGRNIRYLLQTNLDVHAVDISENEIEQVRLLVSETAPQLPADNFIVADLHAVPFSSSKFDVVICNAVLHFAKNEAHFRAIVQELMRTLKPGGMLFCRLSTTIGMEGKLVQVEERKYQMPHGPVWFLADEALLTEMEKEHQLTRIEPLKSVLVGQERTMTTWVLRK